MVAVIPRNLEARARDSPGPPAEILSPEQLFTQYGSKVFHLVRRLLGNTADAEDATQEVFLRVLEKLHTFRGAAALSTWLCRVAVNTALAYRRKRTVRERHRLTDPLEHFQEDGSHARPIRRWTIEPEQALLDGELHERIEQGIASLPEIYRDVYVLADVEQLPSKEVARLLRLSVSAVKSRLHRARLLMRDTLAPYFEERAA